MTHLPNSKLLLFISLLLVCLFISSCTNENNSSGKIKNDSIRKSSLDSIQKSPLDTILGDKIINIDTREIRKNNFESLIGIKKKQLLFASTLYNIKQIESNHFILSQKKSYSEARNFDILLKTNDSVITDYIAFNDFCISDIKRDSTNWVLLLSDFSQTNKYWKSKQQIQILKLDYYFNELWRFSRNSNTSLNGQTIKVNKDDYSFRIEVIMECDICFVVAELVLSKNGQIKSVKSIKNHNSHELSTTELQMIFNEK